MPHHSAAIKTLLMDHELKLARYSNSACRIDLSITEPENHAPLTSFEHVTSAIVLASMSEDFDTLRADIAAIYHAKLGHGEDKKGRNERLRPSEQLPMLTVQHGSFSSKEPAMLVSINLRFVLHEARAVAKNDGEENAISAVMPWRVKEEGVDAMKPLPLTPEDG